MDFACVFFFYLYNVIILLTLPNSYEQYNEYDFSFARQ